jgi:hypothetical protein
MEKEDAWVGEFRHPHFMHKADFIKHMRQQTVKPPAPPAPSAPAAPKGKGGLLRFVKGLAAKTRKKLMP